MFVRVFHGSLFFTKRTLDWDTRVAGRFLDIRVASMLNPRTSDSFWWLQSTTKVSIEWLLDRPCFSPVTVDTIELTLPSRIKAIDKAATAVAELVTRSGISEEAAFGIDMAVREALANAVIHGNKLDETKFVEINVKSSLDSLEVSVHDQGQGFNPDNISDPTKEENILKSSGRGIFFMRNFFDEVDWLMPPAGGTTVRMVKRRVN